jgi:hypothetical protein
MRAGRAADLCGGIAWCGDSGFGKTVDVELAPVDVCTAAEWVAGIAFRVPEHAWNDAGLKSWSPRRTLDHLVDAMLLYSEYLATRARDRVTPPRNGDPSATPGDLVDALRQGASILDSLLLAMPDKIRVFHPSGNADRTGWIGMACTELLVHGFDIAAATLVPVEAPSDQLARSVVERVFPWAPSEGTGWMQLLWATGRAPLGERPPQDADWWWQSAPLTEWDGQPRRRDAPPQW